MEFTAFRNAAIGMSLLTPDSQLLRVNAALCKMLGYTEAQMLALPLHEITHPLDWDEDMEQRDRCLAGELDSFQIEKRYLHRDGRTVWGYLTCTLLRGADGQPLHFLSQVQDVTERKFAEWALRESEERFRSLTMLSSDWYWEQDDQLRFTAFSGNRQLSPWLSTPDLAIGKCRWEQAGHYPVKGSWDDHRAVLEVRLPFRDFEFTRVLANGDVEYVASSGEPIFDGDGIFTGYRGTARDITDKKLAETRLREAQAMLAMAAQIGRLGAWAFEAGQPWVTWSEEVCAIHDMPQGFKPTLDEALAFFVAPQQDLLRDALMACLRDGSPFDVESQIITPKGRCLWVRVIGEAQWDAQGQVRRLQGACQDISEIKRVAEEARLETERLNSQLEDRVRERTAQLEAANKELEAFSYSIAHDLRAPLSSIDGFSQVLLESAGQALAERPRHYLSRIRAGVKQMGELTDGMLSLANLSRASLRREPVDLAVLAHAAIAACRERLPERAVDVRIAPTLPVQGDVRLLAQLIGNLVENAWKFTAGKQAASVEIGQFESPGGQHAYFVRDNGAGFDMAYAARLFEAFQRMHSPAEFEGTGIGLAIVHRVVTRHGGRIWADAAPHQGACFYFTLGHVA